MNPSLCTNPAAPLQPDCHLAPLKILVVEDNAADLQALCDLLLADHHAVLATSSAEDAARLLQVNEVDVVLVDFLMRGLDAFSFVRAIKRGPGRRNVPVIAMSCESRWPVQKLSRDLGCEGFVRKPVHAGELAAQLAAAVNVR